VYADAFLAVMLADGPRPQSEIGDEGMANVAPSTAFRRIHSFAKSGC
jgi:hypothetical protein